MSDLTLENQSASTAQLPGPTVGRERVVLTVLLALFALLSIQQTSDHQPLGVDEIYYFDYALKSPSLGIRIGEQVGTEAMTTAGCRGIEIWPEEMIPECGDPRPDPNQLWQEGYNVTFQHPPAYFTLTAIGGEAMSRFPGVDNKLTAYRLMGVVWLLAGMWVLWYALGLIGLDTITRAALVCLLAAPPALVYTSASVHAGNTQLVGGGLLLTALMLWESGRWRWWSVPIAGGAVVWLNLNNASAVGALVAFLAYKAWRDRGQKNDLIITAVSSFAVAVASVIGWQSWQNHRKIADIQDLPIHQVTQGDSGFQWQQIDDELRAVFTPFRDHWIQTWDVLTPLSGIADIGLIVLLGATLAVTSVKATPRYLVAGVVTAMVGTGVVTMLSTYVAGYNYFQLTPSRYGFALLPFAAIAITPSLRHIALARMSVVVLAFAMSAAVAYGVVTGSTPTPDADLTEAVRQSQQVQTIDDQQQLIGEQEQLIDDQQQLIGEKDSLINLYRCQTGIDIDLVPGGCEQ